MSNRVRVGLIVGSISLIVAIFWGMFIGIYGPIVPLIAGGVAGYVVVRKEMPATKRDGGKAGAISGTITGGLCLIGYIIGSIASLAFRSGTYYLQSANSNEQVSPIVFAIYSLFGQQGIILFIIGLIGMALARIAGFFGGYFGTSKSPSAVPPMQ